MNRREGIEARNGTMQKEESRKEEDGDSMA